MTATEDLRRLLDERGVEWEAFDDFEPTTQWSTHNGAFVYWARERDGKLLVETTAPFKCSISCTPEQSIEACTHAQAIAATLGATDAKPTQAESSGTLTAEKVRELMEENSRQYPSPTDPYVWLTEYDWQAIADELNATLGSCNCSNNCTDGERTGTCHPVISDNLTESEGTGDAWADCSECGHLLFVLTDPNSEPPNYCPNCGAKVVEPTTNDVGAEVDE